MGACLATLSQPARGRLDPKITRLNNPHSDNHLAPHLVLFLLSSRCSRNPVRLPPFMTNQAWG